MYRHTQALLVLLILTIAGTFCAPAEACGRAMLRRGRARAVDRAIRAEMCRQEVVGLAIGIIQRGRVVYLRGYGFEDREACIPVTSRTLFRWASISKTLTAVAAMQLAEKGLLDLDADVRNYVPEFPERGAVITPGHLLSHQSGIVHYDNGKVIRTERQYDVAHPFEDVILALDTFKQSPLLAPPGEKDLYTTHGYILLSAVVQRAGRQKFADQVKRRIAVPLGMTTLEPDYQWKTIPHRAVGYRKKKGHIERSTDTDVSWKLGGGGFLSNIGDMAAYAAGLVNGRLVTRQTEAVMWTLQKTADGKTTKRGLGLVVRRPSGRLEVSHDGAQEKVKARLVIYPREGHGIVVMSNCEYADPKRFVAVVERALAARPARRTCRP